MKKWYRRHEARGKKYLIGCKCWYCRKQIERKKSNGLKPYKRGE